jgi:hypothetical protein
LIPWFPMTVQGALREIAFWKELTGIMAIVIWQWMTWERSYPISDELLV